MEVLHQEKVGSMLRVDSGLVGVDGTFWVLKTQIKAVLASRQDELVLDTFHHEPIEGSPNVKAFQRDDAETRLEYCHREVVRRMYEGAKTHYLFKLNAMMRGEIRE